MYYKVDNKFFEKKGYYFGELEKRINELGYQWYQFVDNIGLAKDIRNVCLTAIIRWKNETSASGYNFGPSEFQSNLDIAIEYMENLIGDLDRILSFDGKNDKDRVSVLVERVVPSKLEQISNALKYICSHG